MSVVHHTKNSAMAVSIQPDGVTTGPDYGTPASFSATSAGSANGTTVISTELSAQSSGDDDFVGMLVRCTSATNTQNEGLERLVVAYADATGTATCHAFPAQVSSDDSFILIDPPDARIVVDAAQTSGAQQVTDATRDETASTWVGTAAEGGYYAVCVTADNVSAGHCQLVASQTSAGVFSFASSLGGATVVGDFFRLVKFPTVTGFVEPSDEDINRAPHVGGIGNPAPVAGPHSGAGGVELAKRGPGRSRRGLKAEAHEWLRCLFSVTEGSDLTADAGSSGTSVVYSAGTASAGTFYAAEDGSAFFVESDAAGTLTVFPEPRTAPAAGDTLKKFITYAPSDPVALQGALFIDQWRGNGIEEMFWGAVPEPTITGGRGDKTKINANVQAPYYYQSRNGFDLNAPAPALERAWWPRLSTVNALASTDCRVVIGTTDFPLIAYEINPGPQLSLAVNQCRPNGVDGYVLTDFVCTGTLTVRVTSTTIAAVDDFKNKREQRLFIQDGLTPGYPGILAFAAYSAVYTGKAIADDEGKLQLTLPFAVVRDEDALAAGLPLFALGLS